VPSAISGELNIPLKRKGVEKCFECHEKANKGSNASLSKKIQKYYFFKLQRKYNYTNVIKRQTSNRFAKRHGQSSSIHVRNSYITGVIAQKRKEKNKKKGQ
jgi:hypothetical protein